MTKHLIEQFEVLKVMTTGLSEDECKAAWMTIDHIKESLKQPPIDVIGVIDEMLENARCNESEMDDFDHKNVKRFTQGIISGLNVLKTRLQQTGCDREVSSQGIGCEDDGYLKALSDLVTRIEVFDSYEWTDYQKLEGIEDWIMDKSARIKNNHRQRGGVI